MNQFNFSRLPWRFEDGLLFDYHDRVIARFFGKTEEDFPDTEENAALLERAPDLALALDKLLSCIDLASHNLRGGSRAQLQNDTLAAVEKARLLLAPLRAEAKQGSRRTRIIFTGDMMRAALKEQKTQTRRIMIPQPDPAKMRFNGRAYEMHLGYPHGHDVPISPYGEVGDILIACSSWAVDASFDELKPSELDPHRLGSSQVWYEGSSRLKASNIGRMRSGRFVPRILYHLFPYLMIEEVRIERLQDISEDDALCEGIEEEYIAETVPESGEDASGFSFRDYSDLSGISWLEKPEASFRTLWNSIHKKAHRWEDNPFVWVVSFRLIE